MTRTVYCGVDFHARMQPIAYCDSANGEIQVAHLDHRKDDVRDFYSKLTGQVIVGLESGGYSSWLPIARSSSQQTGTGAPSEASKPQDPAVPVTQIVAQMEALTRLPREIEQRLDPGPALAEIDQTLKQLEPEIDKGKSELEQAVAEDPSLAELSDLETPNIA